MELENERGCCVERDLEDKNCHVLQTRISCEERWDSVLLECGLASRSNAIQALIENVVCHRQSSAYQGRCR